MKLPIWVHHMADYPAAKVGTDDSALPMSEAWIKTHDAGTWMARFDPGLARAGWPGERVRVADAHTFRRIITEIYAPQGIGVKPWYVAAGRAKAAGSVTRSIAAAEGVMAAQVAAHAGGVAILDLEPWYHGGATPQFWRSDLGAGPAEVKAHVDAFLGAGGRELWIAPDARAGHLEPVSFRSWVQQPAVTAVLPQVYWTIFQQTPEVALQRAVSVLEQNGWTKGRASIRPILDAAASGAEMMRAIDEARRLGLGEPSLWQRKNLRPDVAERLLAEGAVPPPVNLDLYRVRGALDQVEAGVRSIQASIAHLEREVAGMRGILGGEG